MKDDNLGCLSYLVFAALATFIVAVVPFVAVIFSLIAAYILLHHHAASLSGLISRTPRVREGREPAIKQYFFAAGWRELGRTIDATKAIAAEECRNAFGTASDLSAQFILRPLAAAWFLSVAVATIVAYTVFGIAIALHAVILAVCFAALGTVVIILRATESLSMAVRRAYSVCPSRDCHRHVALPVHGCPHCGAMHKALLPGTYGAFRRRCKCGTLLPTMFLLGRGKLPAFCPHASCGRPLHPAIGSARDVHIPVVGGPSAGKTAFLTAAMLEIKRMATVEMTFPQLADQHAFEAAAERFAKGILVDKTAGASPNAMLVHVDDVREQKSLLYIYDAAGELYAGRSELRRQNFFSHANAVALLVDPFSIRGVRIDRAHEIAAVEPQIHPSAESPQDVYDRLAMILREHHGGTRIAVPLAVIVTKIDAIGLEREIETLGAREWLVRNGEANLVQSAEHDFETVRYFGCSALGRMPSAGAGEPFLSRGAVAPFRWLAEVTGVRLE